MEVQSGGMHAFQTIIPGHATLFSSSDSAGTFVRFQPQSADFQKEVGADVETVLEQTLLTRSTLTEGDWVAVSHAERQWDLRVQQLQPAAQVSVIGQSHGCIA